MYVQRYSTFMAVGRRSYIVTQPAWSWVIIATEVLSFPGWGLLFLLWYSTFIARGH
jgi:hypothetical protein